MHFYTSIFKNAKIVSITYYPESMPNMAGKVLTGILHIDGQDLMVIDGGPQFPFTEAISLYVNAPTQEEIDHLWDSLTADGGKEIQCGWLKDKYGLVRQIVPPILGQLLNDTDRVKAERVMQAMLKMHKIIIADLMDAYNG